MSETTKLKTTFWGRNWISLIALILSIIAMCFSGFRMEPVTFGIDRYNFSIDVLSLLITLLIGWQVINVISFEKRMKKIVSCEIDKVKKQLESKSIELEAKLMYSVSLSFLNGLPQIAFSFLLSASKLYLDINQIKNCLSCLKIIEDYNDINSKLITKEYKEQIKDLLKDSNYKLPISQLKQHPLYVVVEGRLNKIEKQFDQIIK